MNKVNGHIAPPKWILKLLRLLVRREYLEEIEGDMEEIFQDNLMLYSARKARRQYLIDMVKLIRPNLIESILSNQKLNWVMLQHNIRISLRGFKKHKASFLINLTGLSTALATAFLIFLWVSDEMAKDKFHEKDDLLYQVMRNSNRTDGIRTAQGTPALLEEALRAEFPEIDLAVSVNNRGIGNSAMLINGDQKQEARGMFASKDFFRAFSYPLLAGTEESVLTAPNAIVISRALAMSLFGEIDGVIGQSLKASGGLYGATYQITGILDELPSQSTKKFDFVINYQAILTHEAWTDDWYATPARTIVTLKPGTDPAAVNAKIKDFLSQKADYEETTLFLQKYSDIYLFGTYVNGQPVAGRMGYVRLLSLVGVLVLLIAAINFVNLTTAQAARKMKEVGVKKVIGARKRQLIWQFLTESYLLTFLGTLLAIGLVSLAIPEMNRITNKQLADNISPESLLTLLLFVLFLGAVAGTYPALYLSGFSPTSALKGKSLRSLKGVWLRKGLVVLQFTVSVAFSLGFWFVNRQMDFIKQIDLGYSRDQVVEFRLRGRVDRQTFIDELKSLPGVINVTNMAGGNIITSQGAGGGFSWGSPEDEDFIFRRPQVGYDFVETLEIELLAGRTFSRDFSDEENTLIINESAAQMMGGLDILGQKITDSDVKKEVIGIVKDFKIKSLYEPMQPCIIRFYPNGSNIMAKISGSATVETLKRIEALQERFELQYPFSFTFIDETYQKLYASEQRIADLSQYFMLIALMVSCLGLLGLAIFSTENRTKEVGIRKVLGSPLTSLVKLLSLDFMKTVIVGILIALALSYYLLSEWLNNFVAHTPLHWYTFVIAGVAALAITWLTVGFQVFKVARVNPVKCLRDE